MAAKPKTARVGFRVARWMPAKRGSAKAGAKLGARAVKSNPYLQALLRDERLHRRLQSAYGAARAAYERAARRRGGPEAVLDDRRARRELRRALTSLRGAGATLQQARQRRRRRRVARGALAVAALGGAGALALSEGVRAKARELMPGSGEERGEQAAAPIQEGAAGTSVEPAAPVENAPPTAAEG